MRRQLIRAAITILSCATLLGAIIVAGNLARDSLQSSDRFQLPFEQIDCPAPPGLDRKAFLDEVRYYGDLSKSVSVLDNSLRDRLAAAFAQHPWVEKVGNVEIGPGRQIQAELTFRTPVLAVEYLNPGPIMRVVDGSGILLPVAASSQSLPRLSGKGIPSPAAAGQPWGNAPVEGAARVAGLLQPHQSTLKLLHFRWQDGQLHLRHESNSTGPEVVWGQPPGSEATGEPSAEVKLQHLLANTDRLNNSANTRVDLRAQ